MGCGFSLVPRPLPDFILQPWRKIRRWPGTNTMSRTENGGLDFIMMATYPRDTRSVQQRSNSKVCLGVLPTGMDFVSTKSLTKDV